MAADTTTALHGCDLLILTAANSHQAAEYRRQLALRKGRGSMRNVAAAIVVADPKGRRVGSGAATVNAFVAAARVLAPKASTFEEAFAGRRVLVLHSGGDSRRLPAYAAKGKLFVPTPCITREGEPADLFDLVLEDFLSLEWPAEGRVIVAAGDLLLNLARHDVDFSRSGVTAVACPGDAARASRHGVYVGRGGFGAVRRVHDFLQKPDFATLQSRKAIDASGVVAVDTGVLSFDAHAVAAWLKASGAAPKGKVRKGSFVEQMLKATCEPMDLYLHSIMAMTPAVADATFERHVASRPGTPERRAMLEFRRGLRASKLEFNVVTAPCDFVHVGTTREFMAATLHQRQYRARALPRRDPRLLRSSAAVSSPDEAQVVIEGSDAVQLHAMGDALVAGVTQPPPGGLRLPSSTGLSCIRLKGGSYACVAFGLDDDCKTSLDDGGTFGCIPLADLAERLGVKPASLWGKSGERSLWTAKLWRTGPQRRCIEEAAAVLRGQAPSPSWIAASRKSLAELMPLAEPHSTPAGEIEASQATELFWADARPDLSRLAAACRASTQSKSIATEIAQFVAAAPHPFAQARALRLLALLTRGGEEPGDAPMFAVRRGVEQSVSIPLEPARAAALPGQVVIARAPVRIDLAGGWSDTPPICHEQGGGVVNMAVLLDGQAPIRVTVRRLSEPVVRIRSLDLDRAQECTDAAQVCEYNDPTDWAALAKAALVLSGLVPGLATTSLHDWLVKVGGGSEPCGIELVMEAAVPKGSGLGTSSILASTVLAALDGFMGQTVPDVDSIVRRTMLLEQMMSTGGGWQDQCGGLVGGIKCSTTRPGQEQSPRIETIKPGPACRALLAERGVLCFTGVQRLAKHILRNVVYRYLDGEPQCISIVRELRHGAMAMRTAMIDDDAERFLLELNRYWTLKRAIDPGAFDRRVQKRVATLVPHAAAYELPGAGGGGFAFLIAKDAKAVKAMRREIELLRRDEPAIREFRWSPAATGIRVSVV